MSISYLTSKALLVYLYCCRIQGHKLIKFYTYMERGCFKLPTKNITTIEMNGEIMNISLNQFEKLLNKQYAARVFIKQTELKKYYVISLQEDQINLITDDFAFNAHKDISEIFGEQSDDIQICSDELKVFSITQNNI